MGAASFVVLGAGVGSASAAPVERLEFQGWQVGGQLTIKQLSQTLSVPTGGTFNGAGELDTETGLGSLAGSLYVPPFAAPLKLFGALPVTFGITLAQDGALEGAIAKSEAGSGAETLTVQTALELGVTSISLLGLTMPTSCATKEPVSLKLNENLTREALSSGGWSFANMVTLPHFKCQGGFLGAAFGPVLSALLAGPQNPLAINIAPAATATSTTTTATTSSAGSTTSTSSTATTTTMTTTTSTATSGTGAEVVYIASADAGPVRGYRASSSGAVTPIREAFNPQAPNSVWDPWGVAIDRSGNVFVQSFLSDATSFVFGGDPTPSAAPLRIFRAYGPDSRAIAVDGEGYEYVASGEAGSLIAVAAPGASGQSGNLYSVEAVRTFTTGEGTFNPWPGILATSGRNLLVATVRSAGNAVETYEGGARGGPSPVRVLTGNATGLGACSATCDHEAVAYSASMSDLLVAVSGGPAESHISVFAGNANGSASPLRTIEGSATGLDGRVITGVAISQVTGEIYAMVKTAEFEGSGAIEVFSGFASANVAPIRTFTDVNSAFSDAMGIAVAAE